jgi:transposase
MQQRLEFHPIANVFPLIEGQEFDELVDDIQEHGIRDSIVLFEGKILDGRNRYRACSEAGVACSTVDYDGQDPVGFVISLNLRRRHLTESQRAMVAANLATLAHGGSRQGANLRLGRSNSQAAKLLNVSERSVDSARAIRDRGIEELQSKVSSGAMSVSTAAEIARLPDAEQKEVVELSDKEILERAKKIRAEQGQVRRAERIQRIEEISRGNRPLLTSRRYPVILADPPWRLRTSTHERQPLG